MNGGRHRGYVVVVSVAAMMIFASILLYRSRPLAGITLGSSAIVLVVLAHLGVVAAVVAPFLMWRRRRRPPQLNRRK